MRGYGVAGLRECGNAGYKREKAARRGAQLRYVRQLEKPTVFRNALSISDICCKCLIFIKLHPFLGIMQLFVMSHLQVWYLQRKGRELIDMMEKIFRFRCALLAKWSMTNMQTAAVATVNY